MSLAEMAQDATPEAVALAEQILRNDIENQMWGAQVGACLTRSAVARLLGKSEQAVAQDRRLFAFRNGDGRIVYPLVQFDGPALLEGLSQVVDVLESTGDDDLVVLSWLTAPKPDLDDLTPIEALRAGRLTEVLGLAQMWADDAAG